MNSFKRRHTDSTVLESFAQEFNRCWLCGTLAVNTWPPKIEIHHIVRGPLRQQAREEWCVLVATCQRCHQQYLDGMELATQLALKKINDPEHHDRLKVNELRHRAPDSVSEVDVKIAELELIEMAKETGYPFPRWTW